MVQDLAVGQKENVIDVCWACLPTGTVKINTDGSSHWDPGESGIGILIGDSGGCSLVSFMQRIGWASPAELWGIWKGLELAWDLGFHMEMHFVELPMCWA